MADAIWNNNYLLSNLDAQKLYAQSPLTTGVSGTSAYIGLEPSARYNETVLYESPTYSGVLTANLNDNISAYDTIKVYSNRANAGDINLAGYTEFRTNFPPKFISIIGSTTAGASIYNCTEIFNVFQNHIDWVSGVNLAYNSTGMTIVSMNFSNIGITKVVGVNRKEV